jgi:hypothetical protein
MFVCVRVQDAATARAGTEPCARLRRPRQNATLFWQAAHQRVRPARGVRRQDNQLPARQPQMRLVSRGPVSGVGSVVCARV